MTEAQAGSGGAGASAGEIEGIYRQEYGRAVAVLVRVFGDIDLAEDAVQDAFAAALPRWRASGLPPSPAGWLITTARNKGIDHLRRERLRQEKYVQAILLAGQAAPRQAEPAVHDDTDAETGADVPDDRLRLMFTCCHPALADTARVALTLRLLGGLTTAEIARAASAAPQSYQDRAAILAVAVLQILSTAPKQSARQELERYLRDELTDLARQIAAEREHIS